MDLNEQQSLQMLRQQNLLLLEQLRRGQNAMKDIFIASSAISPKVFDGSVGASTAHSQSPGVRIHTPKKNVSFSENDLSHIIDLEKDHSATSPSNNKLQRRSPKRGRSPKRSLPQGLARDSFTNNNGLSGMVSVTMTSTPNKSIADKNDTPRSILKRRKIIDDNIRVDSKFAHTPTFGRSPKDNRGLNFSYSDYDDLNYQLQQMDIAGNVTDSQARGAHKYSDATDGSYIEEYLDTSVGDVENDLRDIKARKLDQNTASDSKKREAKAHEVEALLRERLVKDPGNDRDKAKVVLDLSKRPKSAVFETRPEPKIVLVRNEMQCMTYTESTYKLKT